MLLAGKALREKAIIALLTEDTGRSRLSKTNNLDRAELIKKLTPENARGIQLQVAEWHSQKSHTPKTSSCRHVSI